MTRKRLWTAMALGLLATGPIVRSPAHVQAEQTVSRQTMIHERGALVMPFDLRKTIHVFQRTETGGVQQVRARNPSDTEEIHSIQDHLRQEAVRFAQGDFGDPATLHGHDMPGLAELSRSPDALQVAYKDLPDGGEIVYSTRDPKVLHAIHQWFGAQLHDHGADATEHTAPSAR